MDGSKYGIVANYLNNINSQKELELGSDVIESGCQADVFLLKDFVLKVMKVLQNGRNPNSSRKYGTEEEFWSAMPLWERSIDELQRDNISTPKVVDYGVFPIDGVKKQVVLEERVKGDPIFINDINKLRGEENRGLIAELRKYTQERDIMGMLNTRQKLFDKMNLYNKTNLDMLLDSQQLLEKLVEDVICIHTKHREMVLDPFAGNLLLSLRNGKRELSIIDFEERILEPNSYIDASAILYDILAFVRYGGESKVMRKTSQDILDGNDDLLVKLVKIACQKDVFTYPVKGKYDLTGSLMWTIRDDGKRNDALKLIKARKGW